ncbi:4a-hydroxytetrahydrobiopterin dehydratase [Candidatus Woesearchaeota archaeon]|nr:4a-hydroxytetrahydrobiopterin dehydratase [Candidatus Woesearchaeota archaeon]
MTELTQKKCVPCRGGVPPLKGEKLKGYGKELEGGWQTIDEHHLEKSFNFKNFREALDFTVKVGELAEEEGHHPEILLAFRKVKLTLWTHKIGGLTESDFVFAAKADEILG